MRVLAVCQHYFPEPFIVSDICEGLVSCGHEVTVLTALPNYPSGIVAEAYRNGKRRREKISGVDVIRVPIVARGGNLKGWNKLRRVANYVSFPLMSWLTRACTRERFDIVVCLQFSPVLMAVPALRIARAQKVPCLIYSFDLWPEDMLAGGLSREGVPYKIMRKLSRGIYGAADAVAVTSPGFEDYFRDELKLSNLRCHWLPQYAEAAFENLKPLSTPASTNGVVNFTFAGNIGSNQSVQTIVRAAALIYKKAPVRVRIVGSGSQLEECRVLANKVGADNVEFPGRMPLEEMPALYASSDVLVLTLARSEGGSLVSKYTIPRKLQSYLASGRPVVAAVDGIAAQIIEAGCGVACRAENPEELATAMITMVEIGAKGRNAMGARARAIYEKKYSRKRFFKNLDKIFEDLAN